ncbi:sulfatase-like hydrolase/transferase [Planctomycetota bacterium]
MIRQTFLLMLLTVGLPGYEALGEAAQPKKPNFLFIAIDDLKPILGHMSEEPGNFLQILYPHAEKRAAIRATLTPNIDRLAREGMCFYRTYCPEALCNPSRTALLTGIQPHRSGIHGNKEFFRQSKLDFVRNAVTLPQNLKQHGYYTAGLGKIFHTSSAQFNNAGEIAKDIPDQMNSWDVWINGLEQPDKGPFTRSPWSLPSGLFSFGSESGKTEAMSDYVQADAIARVFESNSVSLRDTRTKTDKIIHLSPDQPFFLACGIFRPHLPWNAPQELLDLYDANDIHLTRPEYEAVLADIQDLAPGGQRFTTRLDEDGQPTSGRFLQMLKQGRHRNPNNGDMIAWRESVRHYLASITLADRCVGRLLEALDRSPYRDKTIVVLWSDHGWMLGTKHRMHKAALWDEAANCVMIFKDPRKKTDAKANNCRRPVNLMDMYRTIAALADVPVPSYVAGQDITPLLSNPRISWPLPSLTTQGNGNHALSTQRYRYLRYQEDPNNAELYDSEQDPFERTNRIDNPVLQDTRKRLDQRLNSQLIAAPEKRTYEGEIGGYLFAHMTKKDYGRLYYSISQDGLHWTPLNKGERVLKDYRGHPDITLGRDGRYYLLGMVPDQSVVRIWESSDLLNWVVLRDFQPDLAKLPGFNSATNWHGAPKMVYDTALDQYVVTWHSATKGRQRSSIYWGSMRTLYVTSRDLEHFSDPQRLLPYDMATIDVLLRQEGGTYYALIKDERAPDADWPTGKSIRICSATSVLGPYSVPSAPITHGFHEAPTVIPRPSGHGWYLYYERYPGEGYGCSQAPSLAGPWYDVWCRKFNVPEEARYGCMLALTTAQYQAIQERYGGENGDR